MSIEKLISYPLALLGSLALIAPAGDLGAGNRGNEGAGGASKRAATEMSWAETSFSAGSDGPVQPRRPAHGRTSAESAELRALRAAEGALFPELGASDLDLRGASLPQPSCETPDYELKKSTLNVTPAGEWLRGLARPDIAVPRDPKVAQYIRYFGANPKGREAFSLWLRRSGAYRNMIETALANRNLPKDLLAVMFVESGCITKATSGAGAAGLWQFMPQTAKAYGLTVREDYDERRNPWRATEAAVAHLADLYAQFESWHLALAAYNLGYQQLLDRMEETATEDFFSLSKVSEGLPRETALYVPKILAVAVILRNLEYFGFDGVEKLPGLSASRIEIPAGTRLSTIARAAGTSLRKLRDLNAHIDGDQVPSLDAPAYVYVPNAGVARAKAMLPRLLEEQEQKPIDLRVTADFDWGREELDENWRSRLAQTKPADYLSRRDQLRAIADAAEAGNAKPQFAEARAETQRPSDKRKRKVPQRERETLWGFAEAASSNMSLKETVVYHRVQRGETLSGIAARFHVSKRDLALANDLTTQSHVKAGVKLRIVLPPGREPNNPTNG